MDGRTMDGRTWIDQYAAALGVASPDDDTVEQLLALAGVAAHASERIAAPIACYLVGLSGVAVPDALERARAVAG